MTVRALKESDIPKLKAMENGFPYIEPSKAEAVLVVADDRDEPVMACAAERLAQLFLWIDHGLGPVAAKTALRLLHQEMTPKMKELGYDSVEAFLPPQIAEKFGRRLERSWGWIRNWPSWTQKL